MDSNLLLCRPGFEGDCAAELEHLASLAGIGAYARAVRNSGYLSFHAPGQDLTPLERERLIFARTRWVLRGEFGRLDERDRLAGLLPLVAGEKPVRSLRLEYPDTNEGRGMQRFLRRFRGSLEGALRKHGLVSPSAAAESYLHFFFFDSLQGYWGVSRNGLAGPWENGIPRLRLPAGAPSRSALKLEEGCLRLLSAQERDRWLTAGKTAVDLGAAPGGWSWFLASRGLKVTAVDHGKLAPGLEDSYPVRHESADAFTWTPSAPVDWLVCDVVDKPARTLAQMEKWLRLGWGRLAVFNLKLPMKRRFIEVDALLERLASGLGKSGVQAEIRAAHLYHDREEVTVLVISGR